MVVNVDGGPGAPNEQAGQGETDHDVEQSGANRPAGNLAVWTNVKDDLGPAVAKSQGELAQFAIAALRRLKELHRKIQAFFGDPALRHIGNPAV